MGRRSGCFLAVSIFDMLSGVGWFVSYRGVLVVDKGLLGGENAGAHGDAGQNVDAVRVVGEAGVGEVLGVGVVPLCDYSDIGVGQLVGIGLAEALAAGLEVVGAAEVVAG